MDRLKIIGDDIELDGRLVARIVAPEGTLRERAMEALERACRPEPEISFDTQAEYDEAIDAAYDKGAKETEEEMRHELARERDTIRQAAYNEGYDAAKAEAEPA